MQNDLLRFYLKNRLSLFGVGEDYDRSEYVVFGVPFDSTTSFIPGARFGPLFIRLFSENIDHPNLDELSSKIADLGDIISTVDVKWMLKRVFRVSDKIIGDGKKPIILGGEHTLTLASLKAQIKYVQPSIIIFDAHLDLRSEFMDTRINHATWLRRFLEKKKGKVAVVGYRDFSKEELEYAMENVDLLLSSDKIEHYQEEALEELSRFLHNSNEVYISIDVDVMEPTSKFGVSNPSPNGLASSQMIKLLKIICRKKVTGIDIVEVNPLIDMGKTASYAAHLIAYILTSQ